MIESRLCFTFEAPDIRRALDLAAELRSGAGNAVLVRPAPPRRLGLRAGWTVALTTPVTEVHPMALRQREAEMRETADRCPGCQFVGWWAVPSGDPLGRLAVRPNSSGDDHGGPGHDASRLSRALAEDASGRARGRVDDDGAGDDVVQPAPAVVDQCGQKTGERREDAQAEPQHPHR